LFSIFSGAIAEKVSEFAELKLTMIRNSGYNRNVSYFSRNSYFTEGGMLL
jgi:hypothetical protein